MTARFCHISCQSEKWQDFVSGSDKVAFFLKMAALFPLTCIKSLFLHTCIKAFNA